MPEINDFWYESSQLLIKQMKEANKKKGSKKSKSYRSLSPVSPQMLPNPNRLPPERKHWQKIQLDEIKPSSRKYPYIDFRPNREIGNEVLAVENLSKTIDGVKVLDNISFIVGHDDKIAFVGGK